MTKTLNITVEFNRSPSEDLSWFSKWQDEGARFFAFRRGRFVIIAHK